jgi:hypothetical protein
MLQSYTKSQKVTHTDRGTEGHMENRKFWINACTHTAMRVLIKYQRKKIHTVSHSEKMVTHITLR